MNGVDRPLFSRIPSTERDVSNNVNDPMEEHDVRQSSACSHTVLPAPVDECTMKPDDLSVTDNDCIDANICDNISLLSQSYHSDSGSDQSDVIVSRRPVDLDFDEAEIYGSSTFSAARNSHTINDNDTTNVPVLQNLPITGRDNQTHKDNVSRSQSMPLEVQNNDMTHAHTSEHDENDDASQNNTTTTENMRWRLMKAFIFPTLSLIIYFWDVGSDIRMAVNYRERG